MSSSRIWGQFGTGVKAVHMSQDWWAKTLSYDDVMNQVRDINREDIMVTAVSDSIWTKTSNSASLLATNNLCLLIGLCSNSRSVCLHLVRLRCVRCVISQSMTSKTVNSWLTTVIIISGEWYTKVLTRNFVCVPITMEPVEPS